MRPRLPLARDSSPAVIAGMQSYQAPAVTTIVGRRAGYPGPDTILSTAVGSLRMSISPTTWMIRIWMAEGYQGRRHCLKRGFQCRHDKAIDDQKT